MPRPGLSLLLGLCVASLLPSTPGAQSTARLPVPARDGQQPDTGTGTGSAGLCSVRPQRCTFSALSLLLAALCLGCGLRRKAQRRPREEKAWTLPWPRSCCLPDRSPLRAEVIGPQKENSASIQSFLRHLRQRCLRGDPLRRRGNSKVWKDLDEEAALFSDGENSTC